MPRAAAAPVIEDEELESEHEPTVRESLLEARDEVLERAGEEPVERGAGEPPAREDAGAGRDGRGRFQARSPGPGAGAQPQDQAPPGGPGAPGAPVAPVEGQQPPAAGAAPPAVDVAPQGWSQNAKAQWAKLPPEIRGEISRRETDIHRIVTAQDGERQVGRGFVHIANQYRDVIGQGGVHPIKYFEDVLQVMRFLQTAPMSERIGMLRQIAARQGIDYRALAGVQPGPSPAPGNGATPPGASPAQPVIPPELRELTQWLGSFRQQQETLAARQQQEARAVEAQMEQQVMTEIDAFRSKPESRFFDHVRDHMTVLLAQGLAATLEEAYDQAIHARPDIRAILDQERTQGQRAEADRRQRANVARSRGGSVRGGSGSSTPKAPEDRTLREEI